MFKPGEIAIVRQSRDLIVTVLPKKPTPEELTHNRLQAALQWKNNPSASLTPLEQDGWLIVTTGGVFNETNLCPAHSTILATAEGRDLAMEGWKARLQEPAPSDLRAEVSELLNNTKTLGGMSFELRAEVEEVLKKATLDLNGHWKSGEYLRKDFNVLKDLYLGRRSMTEQDAVALVRAAEVGMPLDRWVPIDGSLRMTLRTCPLCGEDDFAMETNGFVVRLTGKACLFPTGLPLTEWELNVPSGRLVVANDLREIFPLPEDDDPDINTTFGCRQTALAYAANGMSHAFVGNTCPTVYQCGEGVYKIANEPQKEVWDPKKEKYVPVKPKTVFEGKSVANICTDLWWYSICDEDEFQRRCKHFEVDKGELRVKVINVKPGVYRFRHDEEARGYDGPAECVYTRFEWVRDPDPVRDFLSQYKEVEVNAHAYVQAQTAKWPTLYGTANSLNEKATTVPWSNMTEEQRRHSWRRVADQAFCTIGSGVEWHEKGFPLARVEEGIEDIEPPTFRQQYNWYPFSRPYGGLFEPRTLAPSFAKLAFRVLESVISFGMTVRDGNHSREVHYVRERMLLAVQRYRELAKQYPDQADPEYVEWLSQKGRAETWVKNFPLGPEFTDKHREHAKQQRWVPEDAYAVVFDARKLKDGNFAWSPKKGGCWANKKDAERYAILEWTDNKQPASHNCFWSSHATNTSVPLYCVARVIKLGEVSHMGETLIEVAFDYGTSWMQNTGKRKAIPEASAKDAVRVLTRAEYEALLPEAIKFFEDEGKTAPKEASKKPRKVKKQKA